MKQEIGGMRLGSGTKLSVEMHNYERSTHDLGYIWRSSMAPGTLVPFLVEVALPGDTFDINLNSQVLTHPTLGPLFGSFKAQFDIFECPIRLYHSALMQNTLAIGNNMASVLLPQIHTGSILPFTIQNGNNSNPDNLQINGSALLAYLGLRGWGNNQQGSNNNRYKNGLPFLMYWDIYMNYYANKQELIGAYLLPQTLGPQTVTSITVGGTTVPQHSGFTAIAINTSTTITISYSAGIPSLSGIIFTMPNGAKVSAAAISTWTGGAAGPSTWVSQNANNSIILVTSWDYAPPGGVPLVTTFTLTNINDKKGVILQNSPLTLVVLNATDPAPYGPSIDINNTPGVMCGLGLKTYQSDILQNWMNTTWYTNITNNTMVSTAGNQFSIDSLILARKVYDLLNRVAISGGSYNDWIGAAYAHEPYSICISPIYHGGLSKEVVFQEVVSLAASSPQPLGTLAGRGTMAKKHKGGSVHIKVSEPSYIMGIVSLTPRLDYSQGNRWDTDLVTMNDLHKPALDQIGFQDLITEHMAWWDTISSGTIGVWTQHAAGKQPAWLNYMTNYNRCFGNFADPNNEMFMTLNRRYQCATSGGIVDLTTYIDPSHYNFIFAQTDLAAQNFWMQIAVDITARRKMSAKIMPNL